jgi:hypothetical protein
MIVSILRGIQPPPAASPEKKSPAKRSTDDVGKTEVAPDPAIGTGS